MQILTWTLAVKIKMQCHRMEWEIFQLFGRLFRHKTRLHVYLWITLHNTVSTKETITKGVFVTPLEILRLTVSLQKNMSHLVTVNGPVGI